MAITSKPGGLNPKGRGKSSKQIVPAHREIFQYYKDQGFRSLAKAIRRTGMYSEGTAKRVNVITKSKSWQLIMQEYMPEEYLAHRHSELLDKRDTETVYDEVIGDDGKPIKVARLVDKGPETNAVSKGLELAYRIRGSFKEDKTPATPANVYNLFYKPEIRQQVANFEAGIKATLLNEINKRNLADNKAAEENMAGDKSGDDGGGAKEK
jgi:hypothetical protein